MSATVTHTLLHPVTFKLGDREEIVSSVGVRRIKGKDLRATRNLDETSAGLKMIERLTGLDALIVDELDSADIEALGEIIGGFTKPGRPTGNES